MKDETYVFISDVKDKKITARSARKQRTHTGKGGRVRFPSDNLSKKEILQMSGECKSYRLNEPMTWKEFLSMPEDIRITYIKLLREKFGCPDGKIGEMMGADKDQISRQMKKLGLNLGKTRKRSNWDKEGFYAWANGVDKLPTPVPAEEPIEEPVTEKEPVHFYTDEERATIFGEVKDYVEDDLPSYDEPDPIPCDSFTPVQIPVTAIPTNGSMNFNCPANQALNTLAQLLGDAKVSISVMWRVVNEEGAECNG